MSRVHAGSKKLVIKRLPVKFDQVSGILMYDLDNLYPQRMDEIVKRSGTGTRAVTKLAQFIRGRGFINQDFGNTVVNRKGITVNQLLRFASRDVGKFNGWAMHVSYNLLGQIAEVSPVFFKHIRFGSPTETGKITKYVHSSNWEKDTKREPNGQVPKPVPYDVFNPDPQVVRQQIAEAGGINQYLGQIFVWTPERDQYPLSTFDPVVDDVQSNSEIPLFQLKSIQNGFSAGGIFKYPGSFEDDKEKNEVIANVNGATGAMNANSIQVIEMKNVDLTEAKELFETFDIPNMDAMFVHQIKNIKDSITENYGMPDPIIGRREGGVVFTQEQNEEAFDMYNSETEEDRDDMGFGFKLIFDHFRIDINADNNYEIDPKQFGDKKKDINKIPADVLKDLTQTERRALIDHEPLEETGEEEQQLLAEKLGVGGTQALIAILSDPNLEALQKINTLVKLFNLTVPEAEALVRPQGAGVRENIQS